MGESQDTEPDSTQSTSILELLLGTEEGGSGSSKKKKRRRNKLPIETAKTSFRREAKQWVELALLPVNTIYYDDFDLEDEIKRIEAGGPIVRAQEFRRINGNVARSGRDCKGRLLWVCFPGIIRSSGVDRLNDMMTRFGEQIGLGTTNSDDESDQAIDGEEIDGEFKYILGKLTGSVDLCRACVEEDGPNQTVGPSDELSGDNHDPACRLFQDLLLLNVRLNTVLQRIDQHAHDQSSHLRKRLGKQNPSIGALNAVDNLLWQGRTIDFNRRTPPQLDPYAHKESWTPMVCLGDTKRGDLRLTTLGDDLFFETGTIIFTRGAALEHEVLDFDGKQRIAITHYTPANVWDVANLSYPSRL
ncbi:hypothetical protein FRC03_009390 [Tulasnella sp. 419]|nr:hypothetical protein FRC03_009390 [Tulasnella sp. 419]